jgi:hypothetical protein
MGWEGTTRALLTANGSAGIGYSLLTRYPLGLIRILPMGMHLFLDAMAGGFLVVAGLKATEDDTERKALIGMGLFEITAALLTRSTTNQP